MILKSIKWRLLLWMASLLTLILTGLGIAIYEIHLSNQLGQFDDRLRRRVATMSESLYTAPQSGNEKPSPNPGANQTAPNSLKLPANIAPLFRTMNTNNYYSVLWLQDDVDPFRKSPNSPPDVNRPNLNDKDNGTYIRSHGGYREAYHATERGDILLVGRGVTAEFEEARKFARLISLGGFGVLAFALAGAWWLVTRALRPLEKISDAAEKISSGNLSQRIKTAESESELGKLASVLNSTFARLETSFAQQKQFTSDASHELRTPIAVLISEAQTTLARERSPEEYREALNASLETAQKMRQLTESLLQLARLDAGQEQLRREKNNLAAIAQRCEKLVQTLARERQLRIESQLHDAEIYCDVTRIEQVVTNLLTNAIKYNREGGLIQLHTGMVGGVAVLSVTDTGLGIAEKDLPRVFERFYRADQSRTGSNTGLGLAISKAIVEAHGGTIEVASKVNEGSTFTVRLPAHA
jgi:two-component system, OmpR family, sensor kinase